MNVVKNTLIINGKETERNEIRRYLRLDGINRLSLDFEMILPLGQCNPQEVFIKRIERWGCPSKGTDVVTEEHKGKLILNFDTLQSAPLGIVKHLIQMNPHLHIIFYYIDEKAKYKGMIKGRNGKILKETFKEWK